MGRELIQIIDQISREKGIPSKIIIEAVESALQTAARKRFGGQENIQVHVDPQTGEIEVLSVKQIVEQVANPRREISLQEARNLDPEAEVGDEIAALIDVGDFGRIAAQTAKQVIFQKVREAEWEVVYREYKDRVGELVHGIILGHERRNYIVDLGKTEAVLPVKEQIPRETFRRGDRIRALLLEVRETSKGPQLILSRSHPQFIAKLFKTEVPEIYEGIVEIKGVVREPGDRTKIAVYSRDPSVDPVGACVGMKGSRVQSVVRELRGEKIDIIPWSPDIRVFIAEALSPATVERVGINEAEHSAMVVVADSQLSLAIGKKGQNVRLAARLTNWKIDIIPSSDYEKQRFREKERELAEALSEHQRQQAQQQEQQNPGG